LQSLAESFLLAVLDPCVISLHFWFFFKHTLTSLIKFSNWFLQAGRVLANLCHDQQLYTCRAAANGIKHLMRTTSGLIMNMQKALKFLSLEISWGFVSDSNSEPRSLGDSEWDQPSNQDNFRLNHEHALAKT
jgi:hypothetical protein